MSDPKTAVVPKKFLLPFILTTCCFALWGFANDFTNPLVKVFEQVFIINTSQASWLQFAFYTGYFCMAIPAVFFIRKFSYKAAILLGLSLYAAGALIAVPASLLANFWLFALTSYVITYGLAFLETACNPYILAMGDPKTATQRLNLAQAFNPIGSLMGMIVASAILAPSLKVTEIRAEIQKGNQEYIQHLVTDANNLPEGASVKVDVAEDGTESKSVILQDGESVTFYEDGVPNFDNVLGALDGSLPNVMKSIRANEPEAFEAIQQADLGSVRAPYVTIACIVGVFFLIYCFAKMPTLREEGAKDAPFGEVALRIIKKAHFREGVIAQLFYVGAQIMCWTFVVHYGMEQVGISLGQAQAWNIVAMIIFLSSRWICTAMMRVISPGIMLTVFAIGAIGFTLGAIYLKGETFTIGLPGFVHGFIGPELAGNTGLVSLVMVSACMSLMFPTIYGIALYNMKPEEAKLGSAFLIMSIVGGAILTKLQGGIITDYGIRTSFFLPAGCFLIIALFGFRTIFTHQKSNS